jgi:hypothetical protein
MTTNHHSEDETMTNIVTMPLSEPVPRAANDNVLRLIAVLERAIADPSIDLTRVERMMTLLKDAMAMNAEQAFNNSLRDAQAELPQVQRQGKNPHTKSRFAKLEDVIREISPVITKNGFGVSFDTGKSELEGHYLVKAHLTHISGHSRDYQADVPADLAGPRGEPNKNPTQGFGSTMSYARRYLLLLIFNIALTDEDDDAVSASKVRARVSEEQVKALREMLVKEDNERRFCARINVQQLEDIFADKYDDAVSIITAAKEAKKKS